MSENQNTEYKESWRDEYLKWICGFANADGGTIFIGVADDGRIIGVSDVSRLMEDIPNKVRDTLGIIVEVNLLYQDNKEYIAINVPKSTYPVNYHGEYHYRSGSTKQQLRGNTLNEFLLSKNGLRWDAVPIEDISVSDLDNESFDIFRREAVRNGRMSKDDLNMSNDDILQHLNLYYNSKLKRAAVMLFHRKPEKWITGMYTKIGCFGNGADLKYQDEIHGSLILQADRIIDLIYLKYLKAEITYKDDIRIETYPYPRDAIREAIYNALVHNDWSNGIPIQVRIEDNSIIISNDISTFDDWTVEKLMSKHRSRPHNPDIAGTFYRAGYIESWGRGIQKIIEECQANGNPEPEYEITEKDIILKITASSKIKVQNESKKESINDKRKEYIDYVLEYLIINPDATYDQISEHISVSRSTVQRCIKELVGKGKIKRDGSKKNGKWIVV